MQPSLRFTWSNHFIQQASDTDISPKKNCLKTHKLNYWSLPSVWLQYVYVRGACEEYDILLWLHADSIIEVLTACFTLQKTLWWLWTLWDDLLWFSVCILCCGLETIRVLVSTVILPKSLCKYIVMQKIVCSSSSWTDARVKSRTLSAKSVFSWPRNSDI